MEARREPCDCSDGLVFRPEGVFRCRCPLGERHTTPSYSAFDKKKERPLVIPLLPDPHAAFLPLPPARLCGRDRAAGIDR